MDQDDRQLRSDDIAQLKLRLGEEGLRYHDISREAELADVCRRWPLLAESEGLSAGGDSAHPHPDRRVQRA